MKKLMFFLGLAAKIERLKLRLEKRPGHINRTSVINTEVIRKVETWIVGKKWTEDRSMPETAREIGVTQEQLSLYFRLIVGKPFLQWRKETRIEESKKLLLEDKSTPMIIIAETIGINDKSNFRRQFTEVVGCTPAEWRLKN